MTEEKQEALRLGKSILIGAFLGVALIVAQIATLESPIPTWLSAPFLPWNSSNLYWLWIILLIEYTYALIFSVVPLTFMISRRTETLEISHSLLVILGAMLVYIFSSRVLIFYSNPKWTKELFFLTLNIVEWILLGAAIVLMQRLAKRYKFSSRAQTEGNSK